MPCCLGKISPTLGTGLALGTTIAFINFINRRRTRAYQKFMYESQGIRLPLYFKALFYSIMKGVVYGMAWPVGIIIIILSLFGIGKSFESHFIPTDIPALEGPQS